MRIWCGNPRRHDRDVPRFFFVDPPIYIHTYDTYTPIFEWAVQNSHATNSRLLINVTQCRYGSAATVSTSLIDITMGVNSTFQYMYRAQVARTDDISAHIFIARPAIICACCPYCSSSPTFRFPIQARFTVLHSILFYQLRPATINATRPRRASLLPPTATRAQS